MKKSLFLLLTVALPASIVFAAGPTMERGEELFNSTKLGTNGKSCAICHAGGIKLEKAAVYDEGELADIVNQCIERALAGKPLDPASDDLKSLVMYVRSLAGSGKK